MRPMNSDRPRRDPAPSRLAYRYERLRLTPLYRVFVRFGLPVMTALVVGVAVFTNPHVRDTIGAQVTELRRTIEERPEFMVRLMAIDGASAELAEDIREVMPLDFPMSSFDLNLEAMRRDIAGLDPVASVGLRIRSGGVLQVDVVERIPAIVWRGPQGVEMLDDEGNRVAGLAARAERPDLPLITGVGADKAVAEALALVAAAAPIDHRLRGLVRIGERRWDMVLDREQRIKLPEQNAVDALERVIALHSAQDLLERDVVQIDMRLRQRPTLTLAQGAVLELRRIRQVERQN